MTIFYTCLASNYGFRLPTAGLWCLLESQSGVQVSRIDEKNWAASRLYGNARFICWPKTRVRRPPTWPRLWPRPPPPPENFKIRGQMGLECVQGWKVMHFGEALRAEIVFRPSSAILLLFWPKTAIYWYKIHQISTKIPKIIILIFQSCFYTQNTQL